jgi:hypothetical protein
MTRTDSSWGIFNSTDLQFVNSLSNTTTPTNLRFVITAGGNVGIGTAVGVAPSGYGTTLQIAAGSGIDTSFVLGDGVGTSTNRYFAARPGSSGDFIFGTDVGDISFRTGLNPGTSVGTERLRIASTGAATFSSSVGINGVGATYPLYVRTGTNQRARFVDNGGLFQFGVLNDAESAYSDLSLGNSAVVIKAAGNVGIGTNSPTAFTGYSTLALNGSNGGLLEFKKGDVQQAYITNAGDPLLQFVTNGNEQVRITSDRYIRMASGTGGIQFNGDTAAANALDDYEEGTWTAIVTFGGNSVGQTYTSNSGSYTKIGRQVTVSSYIEFSNKGSSTGAALITGLPFPIASGLNFFTAPSIGDVRNISFADILHGYGNQGGSSITLGQTTNAGAYTTINNTNFQNNSELIFTMTYFV